MLSRPGIVEEESDAVRQDEDVVDLVDDAQTRIDSTSRAAVSLERARYFATGDRFAAAVDLTEDLHAEPEEVRVFGASRTGASWPGYMQTAQALADNRFAAQLARKNELKRRKIEPESLTDGWKPHKKDCYVHKSKIASLQQYAIQSIAEHIEEMPTLEYLDAGARHRVAQQVARIRKMNSSVLPLFIFPSVDEIDLPDCSNVDEASFLSAIKNACSSALSISMLRLGFCGRCFSDHVLTELGDSLESVEHLRLHGCYLLSDQGLKTLVRRVAPSLQEFELTCSQRISKLSIQHLGELQHLHSLTLSECPQLTDDDLTPLFNMEKLEKIKFDQMIKLSDDFVCEFVKRVPRLRKISLSKCSQLQDRSVIALLNACRELQHLDLSDLDHITDACFEPVYELGHPLRFICLSRCISLTDLAVSRIAFGASKYLESVDVASVSKITDQALQAFQDHCQKNLKTLDLSFCRQVTENGLGFLTDHCACLESLVLWGCTQITGRFLTGHRLDNLRITGHPLFTGISVRH